MWGSSGTVRANDPVDIPAGTVVFAKGPRLLVFDALFFTVLAFILKWDKSGSLLEVFSPTLTNVPRKESKFLLEGASRSINETRICQKHFRIGSSSVVDRNVGPLNAHVSIDA